MLLAQGKLAPMQTKVVHLFEQPQHRAAVAALIHHEFWTEVPDASVQGMSERLAQASHADSLLVRTLIEHARRLKLPRVYFGTDGPAFYTRLGAVVYQVPREGFWFMRFDL